LKIYKRALTLSGGIFEYAVKQQRLNEIKQALEDPDLWSDLARSQTLGRERRALERIIFPLESLSRALAEGYDLLEMAVAESDQETADGVAQDISRLTKQVEQLEFTRMFGGEMDAQNAFLDIQSGSGGTEAQDWAEMLLRMYLRWTERRGFATEILPR